MSQTIKITANPPQRATREQRPDPAWVRGQCPECGDELVSHLYYKRNEGYVLKWKCFNSMGDEPTCTYEKVL